MPDDPAPPTQGGEAEPPCVMCGTTEELPSGDCKRCSEDEAMESAKHQHGPRPGVYIDDFEAGWKARAAHPSLDREARREGYDAAVDSIGLHVYPPPPLEVELAETLALLKRAMARLEHSAHCERTLGKPATPSAPLLPCNCVRGSLEAEYDALLERLNVDPEFRTVQLPATPLDREAMAELLCETWTMVGTSRLGGRWADVRDSDRPYWLKWADAILTTPLDRGEPTDDA